MEMPWTVIWQLAFVGALATALIDVAAWGRERWLGVRGPNWGFVGRWVLGLFQGRPVLSNEDKSRPSKPFETALGWVFHYAVGIALACGLWLGVGSGWLREPTLGLTLGYGVLTVVLPFGLLQPAMGLGFAASKTAAPWRARINSMITHSLFGFGLFLGSMLLQVLSVP
jgi:hypothetical protein